MRQQHPLLKYAAQYRLQGTNEALLLGDNMLSLSLTPPYPGWARFKRRCVEVSNALKGTGLAESVERYSLKYVNHLPTQSLEAFTIRVDLGGYRMADNGFLLRFETLEGSFVSIVECASAQNELLKKGGMGFSIDTICQSGLEGFWTDVERRVESAHRVLEGLFFGLLAPATLQSLGPRWD